LFTNVIHKILLRWLHKQKSSRLKAGDLAGHANLWLEVPIILGVCHWEMFSWQFIHGAPYHAEPHAD
jgi:hypothetical protein